MEKILVVEDTDEINEILCQHLQAYYEVAASFFLVQKQYFTFKKNPFDLVLLILCYQGKMAKKCYEK